MNRQALLLTTAVLIIFTGLIIESFSPTPTAQAATKTFGNTTVGQSTNRLYRNKEATRFYLPENGNIQSITFYFANSGYNAKVAIYTNQNGAPKTLISQSSSERINRKGWHTFTIPTKPIATGDYWLTIVTDSNDAQGRMTRTSTNNKQAETGSVSYASQFSSSFGNVQNYNSYQTSIYATYTTNSPPTPTPTPQQLIGIYADQQCTAAIDNISWGTLNAGASYTKTLYVKNKANTAVTLTKNVQNYNPTSLAGYLTVNWDYAKQLIPPNSIQKIVLTLNIPATTPATSNFNFDTQITAIE